MADNSADHDDIDILTDKQSNNNNTNSNSAAAEDYSDESDDSDDVAIVLDSTSTAAGSRGISIKGKFSRADSSLTSAASGPAFTDAAQQSQLSASAHPFRLPYPTASVYELDLDSLPDKPWRKPGADLTDWFNYGFDEETWRHYATKQIEIRVKSKSGKETESKPTANPAAAATTAPAAGSLTQPPAAIPNPGSVPFNPQMNPQMNPYMNMPMNMNMNMNMMPMNPAMFPRMTPGQFQPPPNQFQQFPPGQYPTNQPPQNQPQHNNNPQNPNKRSRDS